MGGRIMTNVKLPHRRRFLHLAAGAAALPALPRAAAAQAWPARPVRIVVGFPAGNAPDIVARLISDALSERLGQQVIIDNRPGAGSNIGTEAALKAPPDGYTLLMAVGTNATNAALYDNLNFNFSRDIAPVGRIALTANVMVVHPSVPARTILEFVAYAKANPGRIGMASSGVGSASHTSGELFKMMAGIDMLHVPYRTSASPDLLSGHVQVMFSPIPAVIGYIKSGNLRALGVTSSTRQAALPEVPAIGEFVPGFEANGWYGIVAPRNTPASVIEKLHAELDAVIANPKLRERLAELGATVSASSPAEFGKFIADDIEKWGRVIRAANIKLE
jgi:tripartite-type tricarboxylate transporter receptor subunit TctC